MNATVRLLTASASAKSPLFFVTTPTDRAAATAEGSTIWQFNMKSWDAQIDELVVGGHYSDALALLDIIDVVALPDKVQHHRMSILLLLNLCIGAKIDTDTRAERRFAISRLPIRYGD